jgi:hypothetical protein
MRSLARLKPLATPIVLLGIVLLYYGCRFAYAEPPSVPVDPELLKQATMLAQALQAAGVSSSPTSWGPVEALLIGVSIWLHGGANIPYMKPKSQGPDKSIEIVTLLGETKGLIDQALREIRHELPNKLVKPFSDVDAQFDKLANEFGSVKVRLESIERITLHQNQGRRGGG